MPGPRVESRSTATRVTRGAISLSNSSHFPARLYSNWVKPVTLPPGRAMLSTNPDPTGSMTCVNTIGVVGAACSIGASTTLLDTRITFGASAATSAASFWVRAVSNAAQRYSMRILRPTVQPEACSACSNAARRETDSGSSSARATTTPMSLIRSGCCARAVSDHAVAPPISMMNSRRLVCRERSIVRGDEDRIMIRPLSRPEARSLLGCQTANELGAPVASSIPAQLPGHEPASARMGYEDGHALFLRYRRVEGPLGRGGAA